MTKTNDRTGEALRVLMTKTNETFITSNGTTVRYENIFDGIRTKAEVCGKRCQMSEEDIDDIYMNAVLKALKACKDYDPNRSKPETYGAMIADSCVKDALKRASRRDIPFTKLTKSEDESDTDFPHKLWGYRDDEVESDRDLCLGETVDYINNAIDRLPENYREVVILTTRGYKPAEIADELGCKPNDVYRRLNRARTALNENLGGSYLRKHRVCA